MHFNVFLGIKNVENKKLKIDFFSYYLNINS